MKSFIFCVLAIGISFFGVNAQNLDKQKNSIKYTQLPVKPLPQEITQYHIKTDLGYIYSGDSKTETLSKIKGAAQIPHLEKTESEGAEILVRLESYYKSEVKYETVTKTEKRDDKEVSVTYYYLTFSYKYPLYYEVKLPGEVDPYYTQFANGSQDMKTYKSQEFRSSSDRGKWWGDNYKSVQSKLRTDLLNSNVSDMKSNVMKLFSYRKTVLYSRFFTVKKYKKFEYTDIDAAWEKAKSAIDYINEGDIVFNDDFNNTMMEAITMWQKVLDESDVDDKKARINKKVTEALYNNIFLAYSMMSDFEKAEEIKGIAEGRIGKKAIDNTYENWLNGRKQRFAANEGNIPVSI
ncbi:hypothetical protein [Fulvivirga ligni]|uniref:hypothetical protein n=1 Tax=Fulvivirga ligni TaxID=2904246 RepID=UPI001F3BBE53|nr:hypothetical protein [Fulvivirga ligni]UII23725.1 hypothetical protein LVD16_10860 [Fulvivirga ligni]